MKKIPCIMDCGATCGKVSGGMSTFIPERLLGKYYGFICGRCSRSMLRLPTYKELVPNYRELFPWLVPSVEFDQAVRQEERHVRRA